MSSKIFCQSFKILFLVLMTPMIAKKAKKLGPHWHHRDRTSCEEFSKTARFNPYTMPNETWFVFYYWAPTPPFLVIHFKLPAKENLEFLKKTLDNRSTPPVNWTARHIMMASGDSHVGQLALLVERGDRGQYLQYDIRRAQALPPGRKLTPSEVRLKQTGDNKLVGIMFCEKEAVYAMVRKEDVPPKRKIQDEAGRLNYRSRGGKSYLYQGHHWMPIPEKDESLFWLPKPEHFEYDPSSW